MAVLVLQHPPTALGAVAEQEQEEEGTPSKCCPHPSLEELGARGSSPSVFSRTELLIAEP